MQKLPIFIHHTGYITAEIERTKSVRNLTILEKKRKEYAHRPDDLVHILYSLSRSYRGVDKLQEALEATLEATKIVQKESSYYPLIYLELLAIYQDLGQWDKAFNICQKVKEIDPKAAEPYFVESLIYDQQGDLVKAQNSLLHVLAPGADFHTEDLFLLDRISYQVGLFSYKQGHTAEAENRWKQAIESNPDNASAWLGLARIFLDQQHSIEALAASQRAKHLIPKFIDPVYWESIAWEQLGYLANAFDCLTHYLNENGATCSIFQPYAIDLNGIQHLMRTYKTKLQAARK